MTGSWQEEEKAEKAMEAETGWCYKSKNTGGRQKGEESRKHPGAFRGNISLLTTWFPMSSLQYLWRKCAISCQDHNNLLWEPQEANTVDLNHHYPCTERKYVASTHPLCHTTVHRTTYVPTFRGFQKPLLKSVFSFGWLPGLNPSPPPPKCVALGK